MKRFTLFLMSVFFVLGTAIAQDALMLVKATPANGETVKSVESIMLEFSKEVEVTIPEGGIAVTNETTKEVYNLTSYNQHTPKHIVLLSFEQKENNKGDMEQNLPKDDGTYTYTFPAGCITTADGEEFTETLSFTINNPFELISSTPSSSMAVSRVETISHLFSKEVVVTLPEEPIIIKHNEGEYEYKIINGMAYGPNAVFYLKRTTEAVDEDDVLTAITAVGTYTYTIPAGVIASISGDEFPEQTFTFTVSEPLKIVSVTPQEATTLEKVDITFSSPISEIKSPHNLYIGNYSTTPPVIVNFKEEVAFSDDKKTITLELEAPVTTPGTYYLDISNGTFVNETGATNEYEYFTLNVIDPTPAFFTNYNNGDQLQELGDLEITFQNVNEVKLVEDAEPVVLYLPGGGEVAGTATLSDKKITVTFGQKFTEEGDYSFVIPAGMFTMDGTMNEIREINVRFQTFAVTPLEIVSVTPAEENVAELGKIIIEFNQDVKLSFDENWQMISNEIVLKGEDKDYSLIYNSSANIGNTLEYIANAEWDGYKYVSSPITAEGTYTLDLSQIVVDHGAEKSMDGSYIYHSKNQTCSGSRTWKIVNDNTGIEEVNGESENSRVIFDLTGRKVGTTVSGIYIVNGKKVLVK